MSLHVKRKIIEKHARYAFYRPSTEAISAMIMDLPYKIINAVLTNLVLYFMGHLRRKPGHFFFFLLITFTLTLVMSMLFRFIGSITRSIEQALAPAAVVLLGLVIYSGFVIPSSYMQGWLDWLHWLNPVYYGLESAYMNEFISRRFPCAQFVPSGLGYDSVSSAFRTCNSIASVPGRSFVDGGAYLQASFGFVKRAYHFYTT
ncbi:uncharacterized protein FRV6_15449 [Fusarium oxysporum]|uniref:ABC-2 type transporter domain-containing protein n=1 Tax=Fusarium oxysporum TaxID=5507 RepID=A0A2H3TZY1_FUSOX|nr:uncharacterized protein FRV6_15449 [Fusarium oxysporum]